MAAESARIIGSHDGITLGLILHHDEGGFGWSSQIGKISRELYAPRVTVDNVNDETAIRALRDVHPDIVFSANNWDVFHREMLDIPADGVVNFHNGPLPAYRGVNVPSWAIFNGEKHHSVSWHYAQESVDTGDLVATASFDLNDDETAISLIFRCIDAGIGLLPGLLDRYVEGTLTPVPQRGEAHYYRAADVPNDGYLDFTTDFGRLSALVRALTFHPFPGPVAGPRIRVGQYDLPVTAVRREGPSEAGGCWTPGEIMRIDDRGIVIRAADSLVRVCVLEDAATEGPVGPGNAGRYGLAVGTVLESP